MPDITSPPASVLAAFGGGPTPELMVGGKGGTWRCGDLVLKPAEGDVTEIAWRAGILARLRDDGDFRVAAPVSTRDGDWFAGGWEASRFVPGAAAPHRLDDVVRAGEAFHAALTDVPRPSFLDSRTDPWTHADRLAWDEPVPAGATRPSPLLGPLLATRRPVDARSQVVHGDLLGNVLFADGLPPAIIDWPAYWRPPAWATAVAVVDAICWHDAAPAALDRWSHLPHWHQMLVRALIYRIATSTERNEADAAYAPLVVRLTS